MKKLFLGFYFGLVVGLCFSQTPEEISYQNIVKVDSVSRDQLFHNALTWTQLLSDEDLAVVKRDSVDGSLEGESSFFVYTQTGIFKRVSGKVSYLFSIDVKDGKYRYNFHRFIFHYYAENRNYQMVDTRKEKPLEEPLAPGWQKLWDKHRSTTKIRILRHIASLENKMKNKLPASVKPENKKIGEEW